LLIGNYYIPRKLLFHTVGSYYLHRKLIFHTGCAERASAHRLRGMVKNNLHRILFRAGYAKRAIAHRLRGMVLRPSGEMLVMKGEEVGEEVGEEGGEEVEVGEVGEMLMQKLSQEQGPMGVWGGLEAGEDQVQKVIRWAVVVIGVR